MASELDLKSKVWLVVVERECWLLSLLWEGDVMQCQSSLMSGSGGSLGKLVPAMPAPAGGVAATLQIMGISHHSSYLHTQSTNLTTLTFSLYEVSNLIIPPPLSLPTHTYPPASHPRSYFPVIVFNILSPG